MLPHNLGRKEQKTTCADLGTPAMKLKPALALRNRFRRQDKLASSGCRATMWSVAGEGGPKNADQGPAVTLNSSRKRRNRLKKQGSDREAVSSTHYGHLRRSAHGAHQAGHDFAVRDHTTSAGRDCLSFSHQRQALLKFNAPGSLLLRLLQLSAQAGTCCFFFCSGVFVGMVSRRYQREKKAAKLAPVGFRHRFAPTALFEIWELVTLCKLIMHEGLGFGEFFYLLRLGRRQPSVTTTEGDEEEELCMGTR